MNHLSSLIKQPRNVVKAEFRLRRCSRLVAGQSVLISKQVSPLSRGAVESALLRSAAHGVYDFDDNLADTAVSGVRRIFAKSLAWRAGITSADVVIAGNDFLAEQAASVSSANIHVIPSCVEPEDYPVKCDFSLAAPPRAIWLGSPSTESFLSTVAPALLWAHETHGLRLTLISAGDRDLGPLARMVDRVQWTPRAQLGLREADFGIMPLADNLITRGKCAYKLLQYAAAGLPVIASPVGANHEALARTGGLAAESDNDWREAISHLITASEATRRLLGHQARRGVLDHYSFAVWHAEWRRLVLG